MSEFNLPLFMKVKPDAVKELKENLNLYFPDVAGKKILILTTEGLLQGLDKKVTALLSQLDEYEVVSVEASSYDYAVSVAKKISMEGIRMIIGFGGGTALDTAKYSAFVANVPYIAVPTALSNDGVCSPVSVLFSKGSRTHAFTSKTPDGLLIDTEIIIKSPRLLMEAGVGDIISNYTALYDWELECRMHHGRLNDFAYLLSERALNALLYSNIKSFVSQEGINMLAQSLVLSGISMQVAGSSRPCNGSDHLFCHALDQMFDHGLPHGIVVGIGTIGAAWLQKRDYRMLVDFLKEYGININPKRRGITEVMFVRAWMFAREVGKDRYTILDNLEMMPRRMKEELFRELYAVMCKL